MYEREVRGDGAVYDHETEDPRGARRGRRVADWGVGEELFDRMPSPRRRFNPSEAPRRESHPREPQPASRERRFEPAREDTRGYAAATDLDAPTRELVAAARDAAPRRDAAPSTPRRDASTDLVPRGGIEGRRTVVIGRQSQ